MESSSSTAVMAEHRGSGKVIDDDDEVDYPETGYKKMIVDDMIVDDTYPLEFQGKDVEKQEFRLHYFSVTPFEVHGDCNIRGTATYGGGGGNDIRQLSVAIDDISGGGGGGDGGHSGGGDVVVQRSVQSTIGGNGGRSGCKRSIGVGEHAVKRSGHRRWWRRFWLKLTKKK